MAHMFSIDNSDNFVNSMVILT